jgi:hypothetical protein
MTAEQIRVMLPGEGQLGNNYWLKEIAAQLAEANELKRKELEGIRVGTVYMAPP